VKFADEQVATQSSASRGAVDGQPSASAIDPLPRVVFEQDVWSAVCRVLNNYVDSDFCSWDVAPIFELQVDADHVIRALLSFLAGPFRSTWHNKLGGDHYGVSALVESRFRELLLEIQAPAWVRQEVGAFLDKALADWNVDETQGIFSLEPLTRIRCTVKHLKGAIAWYCDGPLAATWADVLLHRAYELELALAELVDGLSAS